MPDILEVLAGEAPPRSDRRCKVQRWLDTLPADTPGLDQLLTAIAATDSRDANYRTGDQVARVLYRLGLDVSLRTSNDHRAKRCRCFD